MSNTFCVSILQDGDRFEPCFVFYDSSVLSFSEYIGYTVPLNCTEAQAIDYGKSVARALGLYFHRDLNFDNVYADLEVISNA